MHCSNCCGFDVEFDQKRALRELRDYKKNGPKKTTKKLIDAVSQQDVSDLSLLDIGGGIGAIQFELLKNGATHATSIEASDAYPIISKEEAVSKGLAERIDYITGDFINLSDTTPQADIVTLDKVVCCYLDYSSLLTHSLGKAQKIYAMIIPRDTWWVKLAHFFETEFRILTGSQFRTYIHPVADIERIISENGFEKRHQQYQREWMIAVYARKD